MTVENIIMMIICLVSGLTTFALLIIGSFDYGGYLFYVGVVSLVLTFTSLYLLATSDEVEE